MDLKQLEYFVRVAELGSFTRASHALDIAQPALSRQVRLLEVELRQNLLLRNGRGATPTEAGQLLLEHARGILHQVERAREDLGRVRGSLAGRVAIGMPPALARVLAVQLTRAFRQQLPEAQLSISEGLSTGILESLIQGRLDLALLYDAAALPEIEIQPLFKDELLLVQARPPGLYEDPPPIALREIAALPLLIPSRPNAIRMHVERELAGLGLRPTIALEIDSVPAILDLVSEGLGSAVVPRNAASNTVRPSAYTLRAISDPPLRPLVALVASAQRPSTLTQQTAARLLTELCERLFRPASPAPRAPRAGC
ncbi:MAG: hypothetical protein RLZZ555_639 [Pseudomonadota bacterium]|jgi:LysR family nitrogen assimilation transcriptional regulator